MSRQFTQVEQNALTAYFEAAVEIKQDAQKMIDSAVLDRSLGAIAKSRANNEISNLLETLKKQVKQTKIDFFQRLSPKMNLQEIIDQELNTCKAIFDDLKASIAKHTAKPAEKVEKKKPVAHKPNAIKSIVPKKNPEKNPEQNPETQQLMGRLFSGAAKTSKKPAPIKAGVSAGIFKNIFADSDTENRYKTFKLATAQERKMAATPMPEQQSTAAVPKPSWMKS